MSLAARYGARRIEGLHNEDHRFPYAALAATMDEADRDHYAEKLRPKPVWAYGGKQSAQRIAGSLRDRKESCGKRLVDSPT